MEGMDEYSTVVKVYRAEERGRERKEEEGKTLTIPLAWEIDEVKKAAFDLLYPANPHLPLSPFFPFSFLSLSFLFPPLSPPFPFPFLRECKIKTISGVEIDDMSLISVVPQAKIYLDPGPDFVDQTVPFLSLSLFLSHTPLSPLYLFVYLCRRRDQKVDDHSHPKIKKKKRREPWAPGSQRT